jgi:hypothetical protein
MRTTVFSVSNSLTALSGGAAAATATAVAAGLIYWIDQSTPLHVFGWHTWLDDIVAKTPVVLVLWSIIAREKWSVLLLIIGCYGLALITEMSLALQWFILPEPVDCMVVVVAVIFGAAATAYLRRTHPLVRSVWILVGAYLLCMCFYNLSHTHQSMHLYWREAS